MLIMITKKVRSLLVVLSIIIHGCVSEQSPVHDHAAQADRNLMLTDTQVALANIKTSTASERAIIQSRVVNARLVENKTLSEGISSRVPGRIERLYQKESGRIIRQGEPLYDIYSESLLTLQQEFLMATDKAKANPENETIQEVLLGARKKLLLYGMTESQINQLVVLAKAQPRITFLVPTTGVIKTIAVEEGQYVAEGTQLYELENLNSLWVEGELYAGEWDWIKPGKSIRVNVNGNSLEARVEFISPEFTANTQLLTFRASVNNQQGLLKPGMPAQVTVQQSTMAISVPVQAVIRSESGTHVYIASDKNTFQPRKVETGLESATEVEILEGIASGETVVVSGAYLLYSEFILKQGTNPMEHTHH